MADIVLGFPPKPLLGNYSRVSLKTYWGHAWSVAGEIHALSATWSAAPEMPQAQLFYRYGIGNRFGSGQLFTFPKQTQLIRKFVRIQDMRRQADGTVVSLREWVGTIEGASDHVGGYQRVEANREPMGVQHFQCYGLEFSFDRDPILSSLFLDPVGGELKSGRAIDFNLRHASKSIPNRTKEKRFGRYLFEGDESKYTPDSGDSAYWCTRDIVEYLLREHLPADINGAKHFTINVPSTELDKLPTNDRPMIVTHGRTLFSLLNQLIPRHRMMGWYIDSAQGQTTFRVFRMHKDPLTLPGTGTTLNGNANPSTLQIQQDPTSSVKLTDLTVDDVDQVIVQGARRRVAFSIGVGDLSPETLLPGWTPQQKADYQSGGQLEAGFPSSSEVAEQERKSSEVRSRDELRDVFSRFQLMQADPQIAGSHYWDFKARVLSNWRVVFRNDANPDIAFVQFRPGIRLLSRLPLLDGRPYDGSNAQNYLAQPAALPFEERPIFVLVPAVHGTGKYKYIDKQGATNAETTAFNEDRRWSGTVSVDDGGRAIRITVSNKPRHIIAGSDFSPQSFDPIVPSADWKRFIFTVAAEDDRYCEARWPADSQVPATIQQVRRMWIDAGDDYRLDYLVPDTVVGIDETGSLLTTSGGVIRDDRPQLSDIARMAFEWYSSRKQMLQFSTSHDATGVRLGVMVTDFVYSTEPTAPPNEAVNTVITQVRKTWPLTEEGSGDTSSEPGPAVLEVQTDFAQLDPLRL